MKRQADLGQITQSVYKSSGNLKIGLNILNFVSKKRMILVLQFFLLKTHLKKNTYNPLHPQ